jgi:hypothetical protein
MVMYRFEIHCEEGPGKGARYSWELLLSTGDLEEVVVGSRPFPSRAEAESEVHAFRRAVAQARVEESRACSPDPEPQAVTFRRVPNVTSLPVNVSRQHDPQASAVGSGRDHPGIPAVAEARKAQAEAEVEAEAEVDAEARTQAEAWAEAEVEVDREARAEAEAEVDAEARAEAEAQVDAEAPAESEPPVTKSRRRPTGARTRPAGGGRTSETM